MAWIFEYIVMFLLLLCKYHTLVRCYPFSNNASSSESLFTAPQFRSKSIDSSGKTTVVTIGHPIRINCGATGVPKPTVTFYKDDQLIKKISTDDPRIKFDHNILRIFDAKISDSGIYTCWAENEKSNATLHFTVKVTKAGDEAAVAPIIPTYSSDNVVEEPVSKEFKPHWIRPEKMEKRLHAEPAGNTVKFQCKVDGVPTPQVMWYKDNKHIQKGDRISGFKFRNGNQSIILETVIPADDGLYTCKATNKYGSIDHTYELDVQERHVSSPYIAEGYLKNQTVYIGQDVSFRCKIFSDAHPHIRWAFAKPGREADEIKSAGVNTTEKEMEVLVVKNASFADAGEYTCIAGNSIGVSLASAWLKVISEPVQTNSPHGDHVKSQEQMIFGLVGVLVLLFIIGAGLLIYFTHRNKDPPMLVSIKNPDNIPQMTKIEIPTMMYGNSEAWRRMCLPGQDQFEFNIPPDLQWELRREDIIFTERLDEGFFGQVFKADLLSLNGRNEVAVCAVKMLKASRTEKDVLDLLSEMDQMKRIGKHKNIINLLGVCTQNGPLMLVTEYASEGNLREFLRRNRPQNMHCNLVLPNDMHPAQTENMPMQDTLLSQKDLVSFAHQVSRGMDYLAQKKCVHRDLAARNVLVTEERVMKIADFGLARDIRSCDYYRKHTRGHLPYKWMALEAMADNVFTHATDVWSFGVLLWEIFSLAGTPYPGIKTGELVKFLRSGERLEKPQFATQEMYILMRDCWEEDPRRRPIFRSLVEDLEKMLAEASNDEFISDYDAMAEYDDSSQSEDSDDDDEEDDDVFVRTGNSDSISDGNIPFNEERDSFVCDPYATPLLGNTDDHSNIMHNQHARLRSDI